MKKEKKAQKKEPALNGSLFVLLHCHTLGLRKDENMACLEGLEPPTYWFVASHSIQLSYRHTR